MPSRSTGRYLEATPRIAMLQQQGVDEEPRGKPGNVVAGAKRGGLRVESGAVGGVVGLE